MIELVDADGVYACSTIFIYFDWILGKGLRMVFIRGFWIFRGWFYLWIIKFWFFLEEFVFIYCMCEWQTIAVGCNL